MPEPWQVLATHLSYIFLFELFCFLKLSEFVGMDALKICFEKTQLLKIQLKDIAQNIKIRKDDLYVRSHHGFPLAAGLSDKKMREDSSALLAEPTQHLGSRLGGSQTVVKSLASGGYSVFACASRST